MIRACCQPAHRRLKSPPQKPVRKLKKRRSVFVSCGTRTPVRQICCRGWRGRFRSTDGMKWPEATKRAVIRDAYFIHCHKGTIGAIRRVVEPLGYLINVTEWWETSDPPGTFRLDIGVLESGITEAMYQEMERLIADAKPASRHLIGLNITRDIPGYLFVGGVAYDGDVITVYPG